MKEIPGAQGRKAVESSSVQIRCVSATTPPNQSPLHEFRGAEGNEIQASNTSAMRHWVGAWVRAADELRGQRRKITKIKVDTGKHREL